MRRAVLVGLTFCAMALFCEHAQPGLAQTRVEYTVGGVKIMMSPDRVLRTLQDHHWTVNVVRRTRSFYEIVEKGPDAYLQGSGAGYEEITASRGGEKLEVWFQQFPKSSFVSIIRYENRQRGALFKDIYEPLATKYGKPCYGQAAFGRIEAYWFYGDDCDIVRAQRKARQPISFEGSFLKTWNFPDDGGVVELTATKVMNEKLRQLLQEATRAHAFKSTGKPSPTD